MSPCDPTQKSAQRNSHLPPLMEAKLSESRETVKAKKLNEYLVITQLKQEWNPPAALSPLYSQAPQQTRP